MEHQNKSPLNPCPRGDGSPCTYFWELANGKQHDAYLDFLEGLSGLGGRCLDGPGSSTTGVCDVERREDLEGRGIVFVITNLKGEKGRKR